MRMNDIEAAKNKGDGGKSALSADVSLHLEEAPRASADFPRKFWYFCFQKYPRGRRQESLERSSEKEKMFKQNRKAKVGGKIG